MHWKQQVMIKAILVLLTAGLKNSFSPLIQNTLDQNMQYNVRAHCHFGKYGDLFSCSELDKKKILTTLWTGI